MAIHQQYPPAASSHDCPHLNSNSNSNSNSNTSTILSSASSASSHASSSSSAAAASASPSASASSSAPSTSNQITRTDSPPSIIHPTTNLHHHRPSTIDRSIRSFNLSSSTSDQQHHPYQSNSNHSHYQKSTNDLIIHHQHQHQYPTTTNHSYAYYSYSSLTLIITICLSASLTLLNKSIYTTFQFPYPFYLLAVHFAAISITSKILVKYLRKKELNSYLERISLKFWIKNILSVGIAYGSAILASNLAYLILSVSFVQMLKAFTPVILVITTSFIDRRLPPLRTALVVFTISTGVAIAAYGEIQFVLLGVLFQLVGSLAEVARLIVTQKLLQDLKIDPLVALSVLSPICFVMSLVLSPIFDGVEPISFILTRLGLPLILGSILLALALNIAVLFLVSSTNALVLTLTGIVKDICLIIGSVFFFGSKVTNTQILGYSVAALGLIYFKFSVPSTTSTTTMTSPNLTPNSNSPKLNPLSHWSPFNNNNNNNSKEFYRYYPLPLIERSASNHD